MKIITRTSIEPLSIVYEDDIESCRCVCWQEEDTKSSLGDWDTRFWDSQCWNGCFESAGWSLRLGFFTLEWQEFPAL